MLASACQCLGLSWPFFLAWYSLDLGMNSHSFLFLFLPCINYLRGDLWLKDAQNMFVQLAFEIRPKRFSQTGARFLWTLSESCLNISPKSYSHLWLREVRIFFIFVNKSFWQKISQHNFGPSFDISTNMSMKSVLWWVFKFRSYTWYLL